MAFEFVLKQDGTVWRRPVEMKVEGEVEIDFSVPLLQNAQLNIARKMPGLFMFPQGPAHVCAVNDAGECFVSVQLRELNLRCTVRVANDFTVPSFEKVGDFVELVWTVPADMRLVFAAHAKPGTGPTWGVLNVYLFAFSKTGACYRLPLPNLYDDCRVCTGQKEGYIGESLVDAVRLALDNFTQSKWNADILRGSGNEDRFAKSQLFYRFRSSNAGFAWAALPEKWESYCEKIGIALLENIIAL